LSFRAQPNDSQRESFGEVEEPVVDFEQAKNGLLATEVIRSNSPARVAVVRNCRSFDWMSFARRSSSGARDDNVTMLIGSVSREAA